MENQINLGDVVKATAKCILVVGALVVGYIINNPPIKGKFEYTDINNEVGKSDNCYVTISKVLCDTRTGKVEVVSIKHK